MEFWHSLSGFCTEQAHYAVENAKRKGVDVLASLKSADDHGSQKLLVISADTVVVANNAVLEKPKVCSVVLELGLSGS